MSDIQNALTPEKWHAALKDRAGMAEAISRAWGDYGERENDHALAALALWGQPFGFTREDVSAILAMLENCRMEAPGGQEGEAIIQRVLSATERLAALLPPAARRSPCAHAWLNREKGTCVMCGERVQPPAPPLGPEHRQFTGDS